MRIIHVCSEFYPLLKTGGLADVTGSLPKAQAEDGLDVRILLPGFPAIRDGVGPTSLVAEIDSFAGRVALRFGFYNGIGIYYIDAPHLYDRPNNPYHDQYNMAYGDNHIRFGVLGWVGSELLYGVDPLWNADILHAHDWHAGLACAYLAAKTGRHVTNSVFTIHNLAYQGCFSLYHMNDLWLPAELYSVYGVEYYGQISFLKAGIYFAGHVTTVSPTYAQEIVNTDLGLGFQGLLADRMHYGRFSGILNGLDEAVWDPKTDKKITTNYNARNLKNKLLNKGEFQHAARLQVNPDKPLFGVISRLVYQKGLDIVLDSLTYLLDYGAQFVLLGSGDPVLEHQFTEFVNYHQRQYAGQIVLFYGYNEEMAHQIMAAADVLLVPSRFEPCGLTQMAALHYGTLPLVHATGGLTDTVVNTTIENIKDKTATGFVFYDMTREGFRGTVDWAMEQWKNRKLWRTLQQRGMQQDFSWQKSARQYQKIYETLLK
ncbi:MAG: glycogen synthase GlgA [Commensalibacter sp.]